MAKLGESGGDFHDRRREANEILAMLEDVDPDQMTWKEKGFIDDVSDPDRPITPGMVFWLRDIKDKYL